MVTPEEIARNLTERIARCSICGWTVRESDVAWLYAQWSQHIYAHQDELDQHAHTREAQWFLENATREAKHNQQKQRRGKNRLQLLDTSEEAI